jgi:hypothetical protein
MLGVVAGGDRTPRPKERTMGQLSATPEILVDACTLLLVVFFIIFTVMTVIALG